MFDFLFRRQAKPKEAPSPEPRQAAERAAQKEDARHAALAQADALAGDESATADFIISCSFADARLKAAEGIQSRQALERVRNAMRNVDRRVAKLMQARIDVLKQKEKFEKAAAACIDDALRLCCENHLTPSQVAELDRNWQGLAEVPADMRDAFEKVRAEIAQRLAAQAALQRTVMDALARLRQIASTSDDMDPHELSRVLEGLATEIAACADSREISSLPRNLLPAFEEEFRKLKTLQEAHERRHQAIAARAAALEIWESAAPGSLDLDEMERAWRSMPHLSAADMAPLKARVDMLMRTRPQAERTDARRIAQGALPEFADVLDKMEQALQQGALQNAAEHDEALRLLVSTGGGIDRNMAERLSHARSELKRLQEWARWSGRISREELIRSIEELPALSLPMNDLANRVIEARKTWKKLDGASGPAPKMLWEKFDTACNAAYAPVAERNRSMADERSRNAGSAQTLIAQVREFVENSGLDRPEESGLIDWKNVATFYRHARKSWSQLGAMERKERKRLDFEFEQAISVLQQPLERQWQTETARREQFIDAVRALDPKSRGAVEALRRIQEHWQESARSMPLGMREEQNLWKRFREACDALFAQRKESANAADEARRQNLQAKEVLCARLEAALDERPDSIPRLLAEVNAAWNEIGPEPNTDQGAVQKRYRAGVSALKARLEAAETESRLAAYQTLLEKLALCHAAESAVMDKSNADVAGWNLHWQVLPQLAQRQEVMLRARFDAAVAALESGDKLYADMLEANRAQLLDELLHLEVLLGLDSPSEFSQDRMRVQVEVLQDALAGNKDSLRDGRMDILCSLPALANEQAAARIAGILRVACGAGQ